MDFAIRDRVAFIGGGSKGLGKGCALALAREGVRIAICGRGAEALREAATEIKKESAVDILPIQADLAKTEDVERAVGEAMAAFGKIDILVANSGGPKAGTFFDIGEGEWEEAYHAVLRYVIQLYRLIIPGMRQRKWGRVVNIASLSIKEPAENLILSNVFRSGVASLAKSISRELIKDNVTVNTVCPGAFKTDRAYELMERIAARKHQTLEEVEQEAIRGLPLGRYQTPGELGDLITFLCSENARGITGTTIQIDGGIYKGLL